QTVNVTNITYKNKTVYNYGPDLTVVNQYSSRPIQKLKLERQANVDVPAAAKSGGLIKVQGNALAVAAPARINKPGQQAAQKKGKGAEQFQAGATASPAGALTSPTAGAAFPEKGKHKGKAGEQGQPGAVTSPMTSPGTAASPNVAPEHGKPGKGRRAEQFGATPPATGATAAPEGAAAPGGKRKGIERGYQPTPGGATSPTENLN